MSRNLIRPRDQYVIWLYEQESIIISYHTARFGGYKHCGCEDKTNLICQLILEDQVIKDSCVSFTRRSPSTYVTILQSSGGHKHWGCEDFSLTHDLRRPRYQAIMWFYGQDHQVKLPLCQIWRHRHFGSEDIMILNQESIIVNDHPLRFGQGYCGSEYIKILVYYVILQDRMIKSSCDFMGRS